jgi:hypothetical protein
MPSPILPTFPRRIYQNLHRSVACTLRMALAALASPNCALFTVVFQLG